MKPDFSEFTYGYALTEELVRFSSMNLTAAPIFPSLRDEGNAGGGYDLRLNTTSAVLFLQFKLADCMVRRTASEIRQWNLPIDVPFYRMHLRPTRYSNQHELLLELERSGQQVYYVAPAFYEQSDLNQNYFNHQVAQRSIFVRPSQIGQLPDDRGHHIAFETNTQTAYLLSEPEKFDQPISYDDFLNTITAQLTQRGRSLGDISFDVFQAMTEILSTLYSNFDVQQFVNRDKLEAIGFLARSYFDCEFLIYSGVQPTSSEEQ